jgi:hypothetical protein
LEHPGVRKGIDKIHAQASQAIAFCLKSLNICS